MSNALDPNVIEAKAIEILRWNETSANKMTALAVQIGEIVKAIRAQAPAHAAALSAIARLESWFKFFRPGLVNGDEYQKCRDDVAALKMALLTTPKIPVGGALREAVDPADVAIIDDMAKKCALDDWAMAWARLRSTLSQPDREETLTRDLEEALARQIPRAQPPKGTP